MVRAATLLLCLAAACSAGAAEFSVTPIRLELARGARSGGVTVANDDTRPLRMQVRLMEWTQDADGKDVHRESDELVYYPRMMTLQPGEKRLLRLGRKAPAAELERTYRLYLDELPEADPAPARSGVTFTIRFALPVFVAPAQAVARGAIESLALQGGKLRVTVRNTGTQTFRIASVNAQGDGFAGEVAGWYLLPRASRVYTLDIPREACGGLRRLEVAVKADRLSLEEGLDVDAAMCAP